MPRLSDRIAAAADPQSGKDHFVWDDTLPGFGLKITPSGGKTWVFQYRRREDGRSRRLTLGRLDKLSSSAARRLAERAQTAVRAGGDPAAEKRATRSGSTLRELAERWLAGLEAQGRLSTAGTYRQALRHALPELGARKTAAIAKSDVARVRDRVLREVGPGAANRVRQALGALLAHAVETGEAERNAAHGVGLIRRTTRSRALSPEELERLGAALAATEARSPVAVATLRLMAVTGLRSGEALALTWAEVDLEHRALRLVRSKSGAKSVPLPGAAAEVTERARGWRIAGNPHVFPAQRGARGGHLASVSEAWGVVRRRAGLAGVRPHDLRHAFASAAVAAGESLHLVGKVLGHARTATTEAFYAHLTHDPVLGVAERTAGRIADALRRGEARAGEPHQVPGSEP